MIGEQPASDFVPIAPKTPFNRRHGVPAHSEAFPEPASEPSVAGPAVRRAEPTPEWLQPKAERRSVSAWWAILVTLALVLLFAVLLIPG